MLTFAIVFAEQMRDTDRQLKKTGREIDRDRRELEKEEKKLVLQYSINNFHAKSIILVFVGDGEDLRCQQQGVFYICLSFSKVYPQLEITDYFNKFSNKSNGSQCEVGWCHDHCYSKYDCNEQSNEA
jgi:hypothetical protein